METTIAIIPIRPTEDQKRTYIRLIQAINKVQKIVNNHQTPTENRLRATELAARIGVTLMDAGEEQPDHLINKLKDIKQRTAKKNTDSEPRYLQIYKF